jgi:hypothetical protein
MKQNIAIQRNPNPAFAKVALTIAKGPPPEWLVLGLEHWSGFLGLDAVTSNEAKGFAKIFGDMDYATGLLIKWLPLFNATPAGLQCPDDVAIALDVLPRIKKVLALLAKPSKRGGGKRPNMQRKACAKVIVEAWRLIHRDPEPYSPKLWDACNEYWLACGREYRGEDVETWRRDAGEAVKRPDALIRAVWLGLRST